MQKEAAPVAASATPVDRSHEYWWRALYYSDFTAGLRRTPEELVQFVQGQSAESEFTGKTAAESAADAHAEELAGWVYELVRRLPNRPAIRDHSTAPFAWPPFPEVRPRNRSLLARLVRTTIGLRPLYQHPPLRGRPPIPGYSDGFTGFSYDLLADEKPLLRMFKDWLASQRIKHGVAPVKGKKGAKSHNRRGLPRQPDWKSVELLDHQKGYGEPLPEAKRQQKSAAGRMARQFAGVVQEGLENATPLRATLEPQLRSILKARKNSAQAPLEVSTDKISDEQWERWDHAWSALMERSHLAEINPKLQAHSAKEELRSLLMELDRENFDEAMFRAVESLLECWGRT